MASPNPDETRIHILNCIKTRFQYGKPVEDVFKAYKAFCQFFNDDIMEYNEFDFWWYRFKEGNFDLDYDRSKDPVKPGLSNIPLDLIEEIIGKMKWKERCIFRRVSKKCKEIVDDQPYTFETIRFVDNENEATIFIDRTEITYCRRLRHDYSERLLNHFMFVLRNPKIQIKQLESVILGRHSSWKMDQFLKSLNHQIHVEYFQYEHYYEHFEPDDTDEMQKNVMKILPFLKPKVLEHLHFSYNLDPTEDNYIMGKIVKLDQWKQAKWLFVLSLYPRELFEELKNFEEIEIYLQNITIEDLIRLKEIFTNSPNFRYCCLRCYDEDDVEDMGFVFNDGVIKFYYDDESRIELSRK